MRTRNYLKIRQYFKTGWRNTVLYCALLLFIVAPTGLLSAQSNSPESSPVTVEMYFQVKWGHADEFLELYKKNHYPLINALIENGVTVYSVKIDEPRKHFIATARWDYRVTVVMRDEYSAMNKPPKDVWEAARDRLFPDYETWQQEERRRFEILDAHWDVYLREVD